MHQQAFHQPYQRLGDEQCRLIMAKEDVKDNPQYGLREYIDYKTCPKQDADRCLSRKGIGSDDESLDEERDE
jgi:hypothetical protein